MRTERAELTMEAALDRYASYKKEERGNSPFAAERDAARAAAFFGAAEGPLPKLGLEAAKALYAQLRQRETRYARTMSVAEHRACLAAAKRFGAFLVRERIWTSNPIAEVEPVGRPKAGEESKVQLRLDEARVWLAEAIRAAQVGDVSALAAMVCLLLGLRVSEAINREVRDLEDQGRFLLVPRGKTRSARRRLRIPELVRPLLLEQVKRAHAVSQEGRPAQISPPLFPDLSMFTVRRATRRISRAAGVPVVTTHALRATHASLAMAAGETGEVVAGALGHAGDAVTRRSYATAEAQAAGQQERALARLEGHSENFPITFPQPSGGKVED